MPPIDLPPQTPAAIHAQAPTTKTAKDAVPINGSNSEKSSADNFGRNYGIRITNNRSGGSKTKSEKPKPKIKPVTGYKRKRLMAHKERTRRKNRKF
jgi:hypothetical protein